MDDLNPQEYGDPLELFRLWLQEAERSEPNDPNAAALATSTLAGQPSVRMVLVKRADERGFCFFTNAESRKGTELETNPRAALCFHWKTLGRQVRVEGRVTADGGGRCGRVLPQPVAQQPDRRGRLRSRAGRWQAVRSWKPGSGDLPRSIPEKCRARATGAASACMQSGSSFGCMGRTGCTTGSYLPASPVDGSEPGCIREH